MREEPSYSEIIRTGSIN